MKDYIPPSTSIIDLESADMIICTSIDTDNPGTEDFGTVNPGSW